MKWMSWDWEQLQDAPAELVDEIERMMVSEYEQMQSRTRGRGAQVPVVRGADGKFRVAKPDDAPKESIVDVGKDARTGRELVRKTKEDGTVVTHRKLEEGELLLHQIFGKPKSFQNK